ncbi:MAG: M48 family metalloprotease [Dehalococcoidia bacterium]
MWLQTRMFLLMALLFGILYGVITGVGTWMGEGSAIIYIILAFVFIGIQYLIGPAMVSWSMKVKWVPEKEAPELHRMVDELARQANLPKPKVGISQLNIPNAFAFGRTHRDGRICVTRGIMNLLNEDELRAVLGHEMSHIKHRDMAIITLLSAIPLIMYWIAISFMFRGMFGGNRQGGGRRWRCCPHRAGGLSTLFHHQPACDVWLAYQGVLCGSGKCGIVEQSPPPGNSPVQACVQQHPF